MSWAALVLGLEITSAAQERVELIGHNNDRALSDARFSEDGQWLATASHDGSVRLWNPRNGTLARTFLHDGPVQRVLFLPKSQELLTVSEGPGGATVRLFSLADGRETGRLEPLAAGGARDVSAVAVSQGDAQLVTAAKSKATNAGELWLWDLPSRKPRSQLDAGNTVRDVTFVAPDNTLVAVGHFRQQAEKGALLIWPSGATGDAKRVPLGGSGGLVRAALQGSWFAVAETRGQGRRARSRVRLFSTQGKPHPAQLTGFRGRIGELAISPDRRWVAATATVPGDWGTEPGEAVKLLSFPRGTVRTVARNTHCHSLAFSPSGDTLALAVTTPAPGVVLLDRVTGQSRARLQQGKPRDVVLKIAFAPNGKQLFVGNLCRSGVEHLCLWTLPEAAESPGR